MKLTPEEQAVDDLLLQADPLDVIELAGDGLCRVVRADALCIVAIQNTDKPARAIPRAYAVVMRESAADLAALVRALRWEADELERQGLAGLNGERYDTPLVRYDTPL